jgi:hypothetical protein
MFSDEEIAAANAAGAERRRTTPWAVRARYDRRQRRIVVRLSSGMDLSFSPREVQGLEHATPEQLAEVEIDGVGYGLHWETLDADVYVPSLLQGITGTKAWMEKRGKLQAAE